LSRERINPVRISCPVVKRNNKTGYSISLAGRNNRLRNPLDIIIAVDTSKSMLAEDVLPNRLERAKLAISDFVRSLQGDRIGLIAFAGSSFLVCPLTADYAGAALTLDGINSHGINRLPFLGKWNNSRLC